GAGRSRSSARRASGDSNAVPARAGGATAAVASTGENPYRAGRAGEGDGGSDVSEQVHDERNLAGAIYGTILATSVVAGLSEGGSVDKGPAALVVITSS